ncbi:hypothetical protein FKW77_010264 [Venturia effusa]|uniref:Zn(2)-C6 fungal-type domain-containing protein n=1 Tax=Venturia effusa TaxID=50376 RepID=A0A517KXM2_9PEZI|nr:hypothetical protein FKW77_010264 [Venturia effusa]
MDFQAYISLDHDPRFKTAHQSAMDLHDGLWNGQFGAEQLAWAPGNDEFEFAHRTPGAVVEVSDLGANVGLDTQLSEASKSCTVSPKSSSTPIAEQESVVVRVRNKPIPRKGHTKSRRGCFNCKRRKIKCQETQPACGNCEKAGIYEYLMRAMLALGASHLSITTESDLNSRALVHRVEAMNLLNKALARPAITKEEADARFAAFMILTFQSSCMDDGIFDFLTMLRGCWIQGTHIRMPDSAFSAFVGEHSHLARMDERYTAAQLETLDVKMLDEAMASLTALLPLCEAEVELRYHKLLTNIVTFAYTSPKAGRNFPSLRISSRAHNP